MVSFCIFLIHVLGQQGPHKKNYTYERTMLKGIAKVEPIYNNVEKIIIHYTIVKYVVNLRTKLGTNLPLWTLENR